MSHEAIAPGLPANVDAEKTLLGAVLLDNEAWTDIQRGMKLGDLSLDAHRRIAMSMWQLIKDGGTVDIVTLANRLGSNHELEAIGGVAYLASLTEGLPRRPVIDEYIRIVKDKSMLRRLIEVCSTSETRAGDQSELAVDIAASIQAELEQIIDSNQTDEADAHVSASIVQSMNRFHARRALGTSPGMSFGIPALDRLTGGMMAGFQTAAGAVSGVGKTTFMAQAILAALEQGNPVQAFLLEPTKDQLNMRLLSLMANCRYEYVTKEWKCPQSVVQDLDRAAERLCEMPLRSYDRSGLSLEDLVAIGRRGIRKEGTRLVCLDYIQRLRIRQAEKDEAVRLRVGRASTALADLVKGTDCHSLVLSQITTGRKSGASSIPTMFDFRESSQIENDAHTIVLLHREYDEKEGHFSNKGAVFVPKLRFGSPGNLTVWFDPDTAAWRDTKPIEPDAKFDYHDKD
jgi:replicative DNA helicase